MSEHDIIVVGAGPAGATCASLLAAGGRRVLLVDRAKFPRHKVCGDCLNPAAWPVIEHLGIRKEVLALPHRVIRKVRFTPISGAPHDVGLNPSEYPEIAVKRIDLDALLVRRAVQSGVQLLEGTPVREVAEGWSISTPAGKFHAPVLIGADGRNSIVSRVLETRPAPRRERVALQCHARATRAPDADVDMFFHPAGYGGAARLGSDQINVCVVAPHGRIREVREFACRRFALPAETRWQSITPLARADPPAVAGEGLFLIGDAAKVVEPFTGEGISHAMRTGALAARCLLESESPAHAAAEYKECFRSIYERSLWINRTARAAGMHPRLASIAVRLSRWFPLPLRFLTGKIADLSRD